jgi:hypothetical protein
VANLNKIAERGGREDYDIKAGFEATYVDSIYTRWYLHGFI